MSNKITHLMIHCAFTRASQEFRAGVIEEWHLGPKDLPDVGVMYKGVRYTNRHQLPDEKINGKIIKTLKGRGWRRVGYSDVMLRDGSIVNLTPYDLDEMWTAAELTNGAVGWNARTRHICMFGGMGADGKTPEANFTAAQWEALRCYVINALAHQPWLKLIGHNQVDAHKACPTFSVPQWAARVVPPENIDPRNYANNPYFQNYQM